MAQSILQWNCRSIINKKNELIYMINKFKPFIFALSETWLKPNFIFKIPGYSCYRDDRVDGYGGVAILVRNSFSSISSLNLLPHSDSFSVVSVIVNHICYVSLYIPHPSLLILREIKNLFVQLPRPFIVLGDFNCQHRSWGSSISNSFGEALLDIIDSHNICILNTGSPTRLTKPGELSSVVDLSMCTPDLASSLSWCTLSSTHNSDHYPILISVLFLVLITTH